MLENLTPIPCVPRNYLGANWLEDHSTPALMPIVKLFDLIVPSQVVPTLLTTSHSVPNDRRIGGLAIVAMIGSFFLATASVCLFRAVAHATHR